MNIGLVSSSGGGGGGAGAGSATPCSLDGTREVGPCVLAGNTATRTTTYTACRERDAASGDTITLDGMITQEVSDSDFCTSGEIGADVAVVATFSDFSEVLERADGRVFEVSTTTFVLDRGFPEGPGVEVLFLDGGLVLEDSETGDRFTQIFRHLRVARTAMADGTVVLEIDGTLALDCLGELALDTTEEIRFAPEAECPDSGDFRLADSEAVQLAAAAAPQGRAALAVPVPRGAEEPARPQRDSGLEQFLFRAASGQVYQVIQNVGGRFGAEDLRVTSVVGSLLPPRPCGPVNGFLLEAGVGLEPEMAAGLSRDGTVRSRLVADASAPCFNANAGGGSGLVCVGPGCTEDCSCPNSRVCVTFTIGDEGATPIEEADEQIPAARVADNLGCVQDGGTTFAFGAEGPTSRVTRCAPPPADGFTLPKSAPEFINGTTGSTVIFAYDPPLGEFHAGVGGFAIDSDRKNDFDCSESPAALLSGVAVNTLPRPRVRFSPGSVAVDLDSTDPRIDKLLPSCLVPILQACTTPLPTVTPAPNECPQSQLASLPTASASGSTATALNHLGSASCGGGGNEAPDRSFLYNPPETGLYRIDTEGSDFDTILYVRDASCTGVELACSDDRPGSLASEANVHLQAGRSYVIVVDGFARSSGSFQLHVTRLEGNPTPTPTPTLGLPNLPDLTVEDLMIPTEAVIDTFVEGTALVANLGGQGVAGAEVIFSARNLDTGARFDLGGCVISSIDPGTLRPCMGRILISEFLAPGLYLVTATVDGLNLVVEANEANNQRSASIMLLGMAGTPTPTPGCPLADLGDEVPLTVQGTTNGLPSSLGGASCGNGGDQAPDFTYRYTAPVAGSYVIDTFGSAYDTLLYVRNDCFGDEIACNDDSEGRLQSKVSVSLAPGQQIVIAVDGFGASRGDFTLNIRSGGTPTPTPTPLDCPPITTTLYAVSGAGTIDRFAFDSGTGSSVPAPGDVPTGDADGIAVAGARDAFWTGAFGTGTIIEFDPVTGSLVPGPFPIMAPGTPGCTDGLAVVGPGRLFSSNFCDDTIFEIDASTGAIVNSFSTNQFVSGGLGGGNGRLFATSGFSEIVELDPDDGSVVRAFAAPDLDGDGLPDFLYGLAFDGTYLFAASADAPPPNIAALDPTNGNLVALSGFAPALGFVSGLDAVAEAPEQPCGPTVQTPTPTPIPTDDCCVPHPTGGCEIALCEACVCGIDDFCCDGEWDEVCVDEASSSCIESCVCG
jgi:outer membrane protein assembly factor BamB